jgi:hypothetical protein
MLSISTQLYTVSEKLQSTTLSGSGHSAQFINKLMFSRLILFPLGQMVLKSSFGCVIIHSSESLPSQILWSPVSIYRFWQYSGGTPPTSLLVYGVGMVRSFVSDMWCCAAEVWYIDGCDVQGFYNFILFSANKHVQKEWKRDFKLLCAYFSSQNDVFRLSTANATTHSIHFNTRNDKSICAPSEDTENESVYDRISAPEVPTVSDSTGTLSANRSTFEISQESEFLSPFRSDTGDTAAKPHWEIKLK